MHARRLDPVNRHDAYARHEPSFLIEARLVGIHGFDLAPLQLAIAGIVLKDNRLSRGVTNIG